jgi:ribonuclease HI
MGLFHAIQWLADIKFDNVDFVTDSKVTADAFNSPRHDLTEFGYIITACRNLFFSHFANSRVEFSRRQANVAAHILAGEAIFSASPIIHFNVPYCIDSVITNEML